MFLAEGNILFRWILDTVLHAFSAEDFKQNNNFFQLEVQADYILLCKKFMPKELPVHRGI
jgi:hypothetical protein